MSAQGWMVCGITILAFLGLLRRFRGRRGGCCGGSCECGKKGPSRGSRR